MSSNYQKNLLEEYCQYGGSARSAMNIFKVIDKTFGATKQIDLNSIGPVETILKAILMERKAAINATRTMNG